MVRQDMFYGAQYCLNIVMHAIYRDMLLDDISDVLGKRREGR
jgi:hypothetical protein